MIFQDFCLTFTCVAGDTALLCASVAGHEKVVNVLLESKADSEHYNDRGLTALMQAAMENHVAVVLSLLKHGANINALSKESNDSPLTIAVNKGLLLRLVIHCFSSRIEKFFDLYELFCYCY